MSPNKDDQKIVVKSNELIQARYKLTTEEQRLILLLSGMIHKDDEDFKSYEIRVADFVKMFSLEKRKSIYSELEESSKRLTGRTIELSRDGKKMYASWLSYVEYVEGSGVIKVEFHKSLKPYLLQLNENFTQYNLQHVMQFKSSYSIRLYELLKMEAWKAKNGQFEKTFELSDYREKLGIEKKAYPIFSDLRKWVIEPPAREVSDQTDLHIFETRYIKTGRKITGVCFVVLIRGKAETQLRQDNLRIEDIKEDDDEIHQTIQVLMGNGFTLENAKNYKVKFGLKRIERNLAYMLAEQKNGKVISNKAGYLSKAIQEDWGGAWEQSTIDKKEKEEKIKQEILEKEKKKKQEERQKEELGKKTLQCFYAFPVEIQNMIKQNFTKTIEDNSFVYPRWLQEEKEGRNPIDLLLIKGSFILFLRENNICS